MLTILYSRGPSELWIARLAEEELLVILLVGGLPTSGSAF
jgi:hypothetical protein